MPRSGRRGCFTVTMSTWGVLGRERELAELDRVWADAVSGAGCLLVLDGEAGVGKTALAVRLVETAAVTPVWVSSVDQAVPAPQGLLGAVIAGLGLALEPTDSGVDGDARVVALADAFARAMVAGVDRPQLVIADDVQWADEVSLRVLALAAPRVCESRILVVATLRTGEALPSARRRAVAAMLRAARRLPVVPLDDEAAGQVADAAVPRALQTASAGGSWPGREETLCSCVSSRSSRAWIRSVLSTPHRCPRPYGRCWSAVWTVWTLRPAPGCNSWRWAATTWPIPSRPPCSNTRSTTCSTL